MQFKFLIILFIESNTSNIFFLQTCIPIGGRMTVAGCRLLLPTKNPGQRDFGAQQGAWSLTHAPRGCEGRRGRRGRRRSGR